MNKANDLLPSHKQRSYEKVGIISTTIWQEIVVMLRFFGLEKIESFLIHKKHKILLVATKIRSGYYYLNSYIKGPGGQFGSIYPQILKFEVC